MLKNDKSFMDVENIKEKKREMAFYAKINHTSKSFCQKYVDYLGPTVFNLMSLHLKNTIGNPKNTCIKQRNSVMPIFTTRPRHFHGNI